MTEKNNTNLTLPEILSKPQVKVTKNKIRGLLGVADWLRETILAHSIEGQRVDVTTITYRPDANQPFTRFDVAIKNTYVTQYRLSKLAEEGFTLTSIRVSDRTYLEFVKHLKSDDSIKPEIFEDGIDPDPDDWETQQNFEGL